MMESTSRLKIFNLLIFSIICITLSACATQSQVTRIEEKLDLLISHTNQQTLTEIFGQHAQLITQRMEELDVEQKQQIEEMIASHQRGAASLTEVRSSVLGVLGNGTDRVVTSSNGVWVRNSDGLKLVAISYKSKLANCRPLTEGELPGPITNSRSLMNYEWGAGEYNGRQVIFPWNLTLPGFTYDVVENTAKRSAEEFIKMAGDRAWNRPIHIQVITEPDTRELEIRHSDDGSEVYVNTKPPRVSETIELLQK